MKTLIRKWLKHIPSKYSFYIESAYVVFNQRLLFDLRSKRFWARAKAADDLERSLLNEIEKNGFVMIPNFKDKGWCELAAVELKSALSNENRATRTDEDDRVFGIEKVSGRAEEFAQDAFLKKLSSEYARSDERLLFCMANRVSYKNDESYGSGGEWHRDGFRRQMKAMIYLTDVTAMDGPFSVLSRSHKFSQIIRDVRQIGSWISDKVVSGVASTRLKDAGDRFDVLSPGRVAKFSAPAGTLILFDTSTVHAGQPPKAGGKERLALTNYYCHVDMVADSLEYYKRFVKVH
ncbi:hypothetical protein PS662_04396 [Pseudomonas fluorescens]|uniref:Phytanoyl-CoA dioxygenase n=1 Tax=Pseudomonas fluorescens TaxID=294 RepID=A0A5E6VYW9_PSEFL|nr:phytanoyl-CoA dioxygenase family protein [Pseudomonas fluorescens]VVN21586.1 hypothetical protein PS662_04396 [Pseudomonas fluorescens]